MNIAVSPFKWTVEITEIAAEMWNANKSAREISEAIGVSRSAVIGKANRDRTRFKAKGRGFCSPPKSRRSRRSTTPRTPVSKDKTTRHETLMQKAEAAAKEAGLLSLPEPTEYDAGRLEVAKPLLGLGKHECRWPLNNGGPFMFCAEEAEAGPYCPHHALRSVSAYPAAAE